MVLKDVGPASEFSTPVDFVEANLMSVFVDDNSFLLLYSFFDSMTIFFFYFFLVSM